MGYNNNGFEKLIVWQKSVDFSVFIYQITELFPEKGKVWTRFAVAEGFSFSCF